MKVINKTILLILLGVILLVSSVNAADHLIPGNVGDLCDPPDAICKTGLICDDGLCKQSDTDSILGGVGVMCDADLFLYCQKGLECINNICENTKGLVLKKAGESCNKDNLCAKGLECIKGFCKDTGIISTEEKDKKDLEEKFNFMKFNLFESIGGVLEKVNVLMKLTMPFNSIGYSYRMVAEQTYDDKIGVKALLDEALLYRRLAEMKTNYERVGPKEMKEEEKKVDLTKSEPPEPKKFEPGEIEEPKEELLGVEEEFDIFGKERIIPTGELLDLVSGTSVGNFEFGEVESYDIDGEYLYNDGFDPRSETYNFLYVVIGEGHVAYREEFILYDLGDERTIGLYKVLLKGGDVSEVVMSVLDTSEVPSKGFMELVEEEPLPELLKHPDEIQKYLAESNLDEEDVEYMVRAMKITATCDDTPEKEKERGAIAQLIINRVRSGAFPNIIKDVVTADYNPNVAAFLGKRDPAINDVTNGINNPANIACTFSAIMFFECNGPEDEGAKMIQGRTYFLDRRKFVGEVPPWNKVNEVQVAKPNGIFYSGEDTSANKCEERNYRGRALSSAVKEEPRVVSPGVTIVGKVPKPGKFWGLQFQDVNYLVNAVETARSKEIDPCYVLTAIHHESSGAWWVVGNDANVPGCKVISRRKLLLENSPNCKNLYKGTPKESPSKQLMKDCLKNIDNSFTRYERPRKGVNSCFDDLLDTKTYNLGLPKKPEDRINFFCSNQYRSAYTWGIGLGQITPSAGSRSINIAGTTYTHCDLFDAGKNIDAIVDLLKTKGASAGISTENLVKVFGGYVGGGAGYETDKRIKTFNICKNNEEEIVA